jgi:metallo-beta-lactamase class B
MLRHLLLGTVALVAAVFASAAVAAEGDNNPIPPFRIADDLYYVGASDIASYLVVTRAGLILIDGGYEKTAPLILRNLKTLGFDPAEVKVLLSTHAHLDHAGGLAMLKRETGAKLFATAPDAELMARGGKGDFGLGDTAPYPPVQADTLIKDSQVVTMGGKQLVAHLTPGHTRGCTTWTFPVVDTRGAKRSVHQVLILCSNSILSMYRLAGNESYPGIAADYEKSYAFWKSAPCEIFLGSHGMFFNMNAKRAKLGLDVNPFVDPAGCKAWFEKGYAAFHERLDKEKAAAAPKP